MFIEIHGNILKKIGAGHMVPQALFHKSIANPLLQYPCKEQLSDPKFLQLDTLTLFTDAG